MGLTSKTFEAVNHVAHVDKAFAIESRLCIVRIEQGETINLPFRFGNKGLGESCRDVELHMDVSGRG